MPFASSMTTRSSFVLSAKISRFPGRLCKNKPQSLRGWCFPAEYWISCEIID